MAARAGPSDAAALGQWLYRFGSMPRTPAYEREFGPDDEPLGALGLAVGGPVRRRLETGYEATTIQGWISFALAGEPPALSSACKLYVSPQPRAMPAAFPQIVEAFVQAGVRSFKLGRGIEGLLRPDKLMAYFDDVQQMADVARRLLRRLDGYPAQGVPFTAELGGEGLLSAGVDPPPGDAATSWRAWITSRLAQSLVAQRRQAPPQAVARALAGLRAVGVDTVHWRPGLDSFTATQSQSEGVVRRRKVRR
jgi:hypothetical protein